MNYDQHLLGGIITGVAHRTVQNIYHQRRARPAELIGAGVGGGIGCSIPDKIEPAIHPNHRSHAHSLAALGLAGMISTSAEKLNTAILEQADIYNTQATIQRAQGENLAALINRLIGLLLEVAAGFAGAFAPGYMSHLVLDASTPKSIPLI